jgi:hypothetical protein
MAGVEERKPHRTRWNHFPPVVIVAEERSVKGHAQYEQAKAGNVQDAAPAAKLLATDFLSDQAIQAVRGIAPDRALLVPVHAMEGAGFNRIPGAFAELLGGKLGLDVEMEIVQANIVNHTGASGWARMSRAPVFSGEVRRGRQYVLVDDFVGQGGTLANLRGHILDCGGLVTGAVTLTGRPYSATLALRPVTLEELRKKHGQEIDNWWQQNFGYGFECLTESEARYLIRAEDADTIRRKLAEAGFAANG